ncbi:MAG: hypothetical protein A3D52_01990 [Candidatus Taylorbacteria bacterium RIFCSPHIGHO2_02_FULL_44_36]|uniref:Addiction module antitoxin RelB n=1 Tax=Candidatus Taylorbacteria bacterium RIFCSPLOWO2_12_FULL_44_15c TaxID=1802333 RepID=A0A1G2P4U2_9BACT|nr:MAG: hypothetical protein A3D52_01990 [Candidatus Taylorbacteria bacterium RIFCSPHIGHO2_02_FULL_44_36]OHA37942.1 MAG: hypothetical protein A3I97_02765 [Candidatus Taylorbacteria bacterium RIFCSPLOWO2_02_FULL_44_35]OHA43360.1 MAG: hypothetical protein A3G03_03275 [Candidatus Taylorbacteria bacterium RIFCSPLOWO2_12_FULL_44_15c]
MEMRFDIEYHYLVEREDIPRLSRFWQDEVRLAIETKLTTRPDLYGKPLRRSIAGYKRLRVGDYRVIYRIEREIVKIMIIRHRSVVYKMIGRRL